MEVRGQIYLITCITNGKRYVGQTRTHMYNEETGKYKPYGYLKRFAAHCSNTLNYEKFGRCRALNSAMAAHGIENFRVELLEDCPMECLDNLETMYISELNTLAPHGYNLETGGNQNKSASADTRARQSEARDAYYQTDRGKEFIAKHSCEALPAMNRSNNDLKKIAKYKDQKIEKIGVYYCQNDNNIYVYLYISGKRCSIRFSCKTGRDDAIRRVNNALTILKAPTMNIGDDLKDQILV